MNICKVRNVIQVAELRFIIPMPSAKGLYWINKHIPESSIHIHCYFHSSIVT